LFSDFFYLYRYLYLHLIVRCCSMKILYVASEVTPFARTGGLADVAGSLPKAMKKLGHDVRIIMPLYKSLEKTEFAVKKGRKSVEVVVAGSVQKGLLRQTYLDDVPVYFLENREYFHRDYLYGPPEGAYPDNARRFGFFCRGVLQLLKRMDFRPDVIHCNDWQTALIPILLKHELRDDLFFTKTASIYTIHNLAYQGLFEKDALAEMGLDAAYFTIERLEYYGRVNLMKGAILSADVVNTVSETYCREIQTAELGCGLDGVLQKRRAELHGVINGIDYVEWDPTSDRALLKNYSARGADKKWLQKAMGLEQNADIPLLGMVTRLTEQKGIDLLVGLLPELRRANVQLVMLGTGDAKYIELLRAVKGEGARNIVINLGFDATLARQIYAGSDIFLMPSHYEPCGLGQLIAFRYGAVPVVRQVGGLADTVIDRNDPAREPNGFTFDEYSPAAFGAAIMRAIDAWHDRKGWTKLIKSGMRHDFSWRSSAEKYAELYRLGLAKKWS
jgi:starch synthase